LLAKLNQADEKALPVVIDLIGQRRITSANAALLKAADDSRMRSARPLGRPWGN